MLEQSAESLLADYHGLEITAIASEYREGLHLLGKDTRLPKLIAWLGSNIGNFSRADAHHFVSGIRDAMNGDDRLLLGIDLRKDARARTAMTTRRASPRFNRTCSRGQPRARRFVRPRRLTHRARGRRRRPRRDRTRVPAQLRGVDRGRQGALARGDFIHTEDS
jgi:hypothetical protein